MVNNLFFRWPKPLVVHKENDRFPEVGNLRLLWGIFSSRKPSGIQPAKGLVCNDCHFPMEWRSFWNVPNAISQHEFFCPHNSCAGKLFRSLRWVFHSIQPVRTKIKSCRTRQRSPTPLLNYIIVHCFQNWPKSWPFNINYRNRQPLESINARSAGKISQCFRENIHRAPNPKDLLGCAVTEVLGSMVSTLRIHGTNGIFTYMNGWFLWFSCRQIYQSHGSSGVSSF